MLEGVAPPADLVAVLRYLPRSADEHGRPTGVETVEPIEPFDAEKQLTAGDVGGVVWRAEGLTRLYPLFRDLAEVHGDIAEMFRVLGVHLRHGNLLVALADRANVTEVARFFFSPKTADRYAEWLLRATSGAVGLCLTPT
jgi:hypothetical protein